MKQYFLWLLILITNCKPFFFYYY